MNTAAARTAVQGIADFLRASDNLTDMEREALAALDRDEQAAIERGVAVLTETATEPEAATPQRQARIETFTVFAPEQLRHAGAHYLARKASTPNVTTIDWADWGNHRAS